MPSVPIQRVRSRSSHCDATGTSPCHKIILLPYAGSQEDVSRLQRFSFYGGNHPEWTKYGPFPRTPYEAKFDHFRILGSRDATLDGNDKPKNIRSQQYTSVLHSFSYCMNQISIRPIQSPTSFPTLLRSAVNTAFPLPARRF
jgi:hypothetical protein